MHEPRLAEVCQRFNHCGLGISEQIIVCSNRKLIKPRCLPATSLLSDHPSGCRLKEKGRIFREAFLAKLALLLRGTVQAPPDRFGETLADEHIRGGAVSSLLKEHPQGEH